MLGLLAPFHTFSTVVASSVWTSYATALQCSAMALPVFPAGVVPRHGRCEEGDWEPHIGRALEAPTQILLGV